MFDIYYVRFRFPRNRFVVLTTRPDRDRKMTAWLTVLTSLFAMLMEWRPQKMEALAASATGASPAITAPAHAWGSAAAPALSLHSAS